MNNKMICMSLFTLALSGCLDAVNDDTPVAETESALSGGPWTWDNSATLRCLDSDLAGSVYTLNCNNGSFQRWTNTPLAFGDQVRDLATNYCLDSDFTGHAYTGVCNGGSFQQWVVRNTGTFGWEMRNVATGLCLDSNTSGTVYTLGCNNGNFQRWR